MSEGIMQADQPETREAAGKDLFSKFDPIIQMRENLLEIFGDAGRHARAAVGVPALPLHAVVEVDAVIALKEG